MTPEGRSHIITRLTNAPDLDALRRVWDSVSFEYQADPKIQEFKDKMKRQLGEES